MADKHAITVSKWAAVSATGRGMPASISAAVMVVASPFRSLANGFADDDGGRFPDADLTELLLGTDDDDDTEVEGSSLASSATSNTNEAASSLLGTYSATGVIVV